ncbi:MAG: pyrophosphohydrolase domain-containing protein [Planctomycetota bacterium]|jgi:predicted HAD superfamily Cof-like phosphohydrolase
MDFNQTIEMVRQFHQHIGAPIADKPQLLPGKPREADFLAARIANLGRLARRGAGGDSFLERLALALEELAEWAAAHAKQDLVAAADAWADRAYVLMGDAVACGLPAQELFEEIHRSNMTKQYGVRTGVGKAYRGAGYEAPKIRRILDAAETLEELHEFLALDEDDEDEDGD